MFVQHILDFVKTFETEQLTPSDSKLIDGLLTYITPKSPGTLLTEDDVQFLLGCYKIRWDVLADSEDDYMHNPSTANKKWIELARQIGLFTKRNYLKILIPALINDMDLNDFSSLNETVNLFNFYLGYGGKTLFRKWSLCEHLKKRQFTLSTHRSLAIRKLNPITVDELARLKLCKEITRQVTVETENFENFWDFMRKKVFVHLQEQGDISIGILPNLLELINRYYYLRENGSDFTVFKNDVSVFFDSLYNCDLSNVNYMYGVQVEYREKEQYLLDVFIALYTASSFNLDLEMRVLSSWLFQFNPLLRSSRYELEPIYAKLAARDGFTGNAADISSESLARCCSLMVSLLTTQFKISVFFARHTYSLWDKENTVFSEACGIFTILLPLIAANRSDAIASAYGDIIRDIISPARGDKSWYTWFTRNKQTTRWLELAYSSRLNELDVYWFEPELIFFALLHFRPMNQVIKPYINAFLDDLIQTYAQDQNDLMKQFRVNILFNEFMSGLNENHRRNLLLLIKLCDLRTAKSSFLINCTRHVNKRLYQLCQPQSEGTTPQVFSFTQPEGAQSVGEVIARYKEQSSALRHEPTIFESVSNYLAGKIGSPILTCAQKEAAKSRPMEYDLYMGRYPR